MVCHPCRAGAGNRTEAAYSRADGVGEILCREATRESGVRGVWGGNRGYIHVKSSDDSTWEGRNMTAPLEPQDGRGPRTYKMSFPEKGGQRRCPVERCPGVLATRVAMRVNFVHRNVHNTVVILEEGNLPLPRCPRCDLQVSRKALNRRHLGTSQCRTGTEQKRRRLAEGRCGRTRSGRSTPMGSR